MRPSLLIVLVVVLGVYVHAAGARARGVVADESGGVLPGVTVVATAPDGRVLATAVTDAVGRYTLDGLPAATVTVTFQLEGFSVAAAELTMSGDTDATVRTQRLKLASKSETVEVRGEVRVSAPPPPPAPRLPPLPPPPPRVLKAIPDHDRDSVCGPAKPAGAADAFGTIRAGHSARGNGLFAAGDEVSIERTAGLEVGQNFVARRAYRTSTDPAGVPGEHTAGLMQIVAVDQHAAAAVVIYACDEVMPGDWLAPFTPEPIVAPEPAGTPAYDRAARILLTDAGQLIGAPRRLMVIDRGSDNGIRAGQRLTLFRPARAGAKRPTVIGDAVVVAVRLDSATIRIQRATDVIEIGDSAAPQQ
jgi:Carboxypeptidase regulatory-like domain